MDYSPINFNDKNSLTFDVGVVIALPEELKYFLKYVSQTDIFKQPEPKMIWHNQLPYWVFKLESKSKEVAVQVVVHAIGEMGSEHASLATKHILETWRPPFLINIGLAGSLDHKDLAIGSILIPSQVTHIDANVKVESKEDDQCYDFLYGTRCFHTNATTMHQINSFLVSKLYDAWQNDCELKGGDRSVPEVVVGHHASSNMLIDSEKFIKQIKATDRKLMACDMEAAGFAIATNGVTDVIQLSTQFLVIRAISDNASGKAKTEEHGMRESRHGSISHREYAMRNATKLLLRLICDDVLHVDYEAQLHKIDNHLKQMNETKKLTQQRANRSFRNIERLLQNISKPSELGDLDIDEMIGISEYLKFELPKCKNSENVNKTAFKKAVQTRYSLRDHKIIKRCDGGIEDVTLKLEETSQCQLRSDQTAMEKGNSDGESVCDEPDGRVEIKSDQPAMEKGNSDGESVCDEPDSRVGGKRKYAEMSCESDSDARVEVMNELKNLLMYLEGCKMLNDEAKNLCNEICDKVKALVN